MKIGVLTGGGDSPAINATLRAIVHQASKYGFSLTAIKDGWAGLVNGWFFDLSRDIVEDSHTKSGTILGSSRTNPFKINKVEEVKANFKKANLDTLIAIGGDDTNGVLHKLHNIDEPIKGVGIPQTIDNDILGTDYAIGFDTSVNVATKSIDTVRTTAESHHRIMVIEVMGRDAGHIALQAGVASGAHVILVPEEDFDLNDVADYLKKRKKEGNEFSLVVAAEGAKMTGGKQVVSTGKVDQFGHVMLGGLGKFLSEELEERTGIEARYVNLGHLQRGGVPTSLDRFISARFGIKAVDLIKEGQFNKLVALKGTDVVAVDLGEGLAETKPIDIELYHKVKMF